MAMGFKPGAKQRVIPLAKSSESGDTELRALSNGPLSVAIGRVQTSLTDGIGNTVNLPAAWPDGIVNIRVLPLLFNGTDWDRFRNNQEIALLASATRDSSTATVIFTNYNARGLMWIMKITDRTVGASPLVRINVRVRDDNTGTAFNYTYVDIDPTVGTHVGFVYPGIANVVAGTYNNIDMISPLVLPRRWDMYIQYVQDITDLTYALSAHLIL